MDTPGWYRLSPSEGAEVAIVDTVDRYVETDKMVVGGIGLVTVWYRLGLLLAVFSLVLKQCEL